jgi:quercetin dioxygenase-like cupin family protein
MQIHADLNRRVAIDTHAVEWVDSPSRGVQRKMLDRDGAEVARATSIVRYAPGSSFPTHQHELGEEIFVLDGDFHDEAGSHGPGTFIRNPPGSSHAPGSVNGCTLFVKLRHVHPDDLQRGHIDFHAQARGIAERDHAITIERKRISGQFACQGFRFERVFADDMNFEAGEGNKRGGQRQP